MHAQIQSSPSLYYCRTSSVKIRCEAGCRWYGQRENHASKTELQQNDLGPFGNAIPSRGCVRYTGVCCATTVRSSWRVWRRSPPFKRKACVTCIGGSAFITDPTTAYAASENLPAQMMETWHGRECHRRSVRPKNAPARRNRVSSRPNSGIPPLRSRNSRIGQGWKTAFIPMLGFLRDGPGNSAGSADFGRADAPRPIAGYAGCNENFVLLTTGITGVLSFEL